MRKEKRLIFAQYDYFSESFFEAFHIRGQDESSKRYLKRSNIMT